MTDLEALLKSVEKRGFIGGPTERINLAWEALWMMQNQPGISFRCGPLALKSILKLDRSLLTSTLRSNATEDGSAATNAMMEIFNSASTQKGFSQVAELSKKVGLNYQMAFRLGSAGDSPAPLGDPPSGTGRTAAKFMTNSTSQRPAIPSGGSPDGTGGSPVLPFIVPSVVHWKVGHYAAIVRQDGDRFLVEDLTFGNSVWATREALEAETSGYFLIPPGDLPRGWRSVDAKEGAAVWGKGVTGGNDPNQYTCSNEQTASCTGSGCGMAVASVHLMLANLQVRDTPVGYTPPVGPPVYFTVRYNHRDYLQPASEVDKRLGPKWTHDWNGYIKIGGADATYIVEGGGARIFTGFDTNTQTFAPNQYDQTVLKNTGAGTYEMTWPDGSRKIFGPQFMPALGAALTRVMDPAGNAVTLTYSGERLVAVTDAIGQVTTISYGDTNNPALITKVTDPFGRFATFEYDEKPIALPNYVSPDEFGLGHEHIYFLTKITDVLGLESQFAYDGQFVGTAHTGDSIHEVYSSASDIIRSMTTPYGTTFFTLSGGPPTTNNIRIAQIIYPDGSAKRVEYNQSGNLGIPNSRASRHGSGRDVGPQRVSLSAKHVLLESDSAGQQWGLLRQGEDLPLAARGEQDAHVGNS